jgi:hypothetical protein
MHFMISDKYFFFDSHGMNIRSFQNPSSRPEKTGGDNIKTSSINRMNLRSMIYQIGDQKITLSI